MDAWYTYMLQQNRISIKIFTYRDNFNYTDGMVIQLWGHTTPSLLIPSS